MNIQEKLIEIQKELKAPKSQYNNFGKYSYRSAEDILEAVKPICHEQKCTITLSDEVKELNNGWVYITAIATLSDAESSISVQAHARESETRKGMDSSQITGSSSSYARKYALNGLFAIDDTKDSDATNKGDFKPKQEIQDNGFITFQQRQELMKLASDQHGEDKAAGVIMAMLEKLGVNKTDKIKTAQYETAKLLVGGNQ